MKCTFLGHSTLLLQSGADAVLTDPLLTPRIMLKKRATAPGLALQDLPRLTAITISHAHTDHLHLPSLALLPRDCLLIVPSGVGRFVRRLGFSEVRELAWGESTTAVAGHRGEQLRPGRRRPCVLRRRRHRLRSVAGDGPVG
jgi:L-ascorbate metabolism protein UlaG (beta-lactamase superfamily)